MFVCVCVLLLAVARLLQHSFLLHLQVALHGSHIIYNSRQIKLGICCCYLTTTSAPQSSLPIKLLIPPTCPSQDQSGLTNFRTCAFRIQSGAVVWAMCSIEENWRGAGDNSTAGPTAMRWCKQYGVS